MEIYEWYRNQYAKVDGSWEFLPDESEVLYITRQWFEAKTDGELGFWESISSELAVSRDRFGDVCGIVCVNPDGTRKFEEDFYEIRIDEGGLGWREREALGESEDMRCIPVVERTDEHVVLRFGEDTTADYDVMTGRWCG